VLPLRAFRLNVGLGYLFCPKSPSATPVRATEGLV